MIFQRIKNLFKSEEIKKLPHEICPDVLHWEKGDRIYLTKFIDNETGENYNINKYKFTFLSLDESYVYILRETYKNWPDVYEYLQNKIEKIPINDLNLIENGSLICRKERSKQKKKNENDKNKYEETLNYIKANDFYMQFLNEYKKLNDDK